MEEDVAEDDGRLLQGRRAAHTRLVGSLDHCVRLRVRVSVVQLYVFFVCLITRSMIDCVLTVFCAHVRVLEHGSRQRKTMFLK